MNWKEHPHLFANGKFEVMLDWDDISPFKILGYSSENNGFLFKGSKLFYESIDVCQLIARPIEDMTDEEIREMCNRENWDKSQCQAMREHLIQISSDRTMPFETAIELLDREICPFPDTEDVIFKPKQS